MFELGLAASMVAGITLSSGRPACGLSGIALIWAGAARTLIHTQIDYLAYPAFRKVRLTQLTELLLIYRFTQMPVNECGLTACLGLHLLGGWQPGRTSTEAKANIVQCHLLAVFPLIPLRFQPSKHMPTNQEADRQLGRISISRSLILSIILNVGWLLDTTKVIVVVSTRHWIAQTPLVLRKQMRHLPIKFIKNEICTTSAIMLCSASL
ncbi:hypothetical protein [Fuscovulum ytuae]|uniref:Uncharacterized protein n=1 Tax=Fuscovulum ytuae TaxID=3042299 RepID=A0ABY8Q5K9_9RHOB|nr:hypothetical protein [Fuscovulum sp. YMD61]WGV15922.1 hypothetical protein QF092_16975 [Fuscovulum sp. YMD61]